MRTILFGAAAIACCIAAAPQAQSGKTTPKSKPKPITLVGCVASDDGNGQLTLSDAESGTTYRLTGTDVRKYAGKRIEIVGRPADSTKLKIRGGLTPSPNVAAQAGAMDPAQAAIATSSGGTTAATGNAELPQFRVQMVKPVAGECPPTNR